MSDTFQYDAFLSHSAKDKPVVRAAAERKFINFAHTSYAASRYSDFHCQTRLRTTSTAIDATQKSVNRTSDRLRAAHKLIPEQEQWLSLRRENLVKNLSLGLEDSDLPPLLEMRAGRGGEGRDGFWRTEFFVTQIDKAVTGYTLK